MIAVLTGIILIVTAALDYFVESKKTRIPWVILLIVMALILTGLEWRKDVESEKESDFVKAQLILANVSLTNAVLTIKGMNDGGDSYADPTFFIEYGPQEVTNALKLQLDKKGTFQVRGVSIKVLNKDKHSEIYNHYVGDLSYFSWNPPPVVCDVPLDFSVTNHIQIDIQELNGYLYQTYDISRVTNGWRVKLVAESRDIQGIKTIEAPTNSMGLENEILSF